MKKIILILLVLVNMNMFSQTKDENNSPQQMVEDFFKAFHAQDTLKLKGFAAENAKLQSVSLNAEGNTKLSTSDYSEFVKSIVSIPAENTFEEVLHEYRIERNGLLATVTTPYSFYYNGILSHCGVNSFQLVKFNAEWKIVHLIDTRTKKDCN